jgi:hypothetical protein
MSPTAAQPAVGGRPSWNGRRGMARPQWRNPHPWLDTHDGLGLTSGKLNDREVAADMAQRYKAKNPPARRGKPAIGNR